jgi:hypothetical protein
LSAKSDTRSEIAKLARLLHVEEDSLDYLGGVPAKELREYRERVVDLLYDDDREQLSRAAEASRLLPAGTLAKIGERALGPLICAHLSGLLDPQRAAEIAQHFPTEFLVELAAEMDPRRAVAVIAATPPQTVVKIAVAMAHGGEHVAMGRFVAHLDDATLTEAIERLSDEDLLQVAFVLEGERAHERMFDLAGVERMRPMLGGAKGAGLEEEAAHLRDNLSAAQRKKLQAKAAK